MDLGPTGKLWPTRGWGAQSGCEQHGGLGTPSENTNHFRSQRGVPILQGIGKSWEPQVVMGCWDPQNGFESLGEAVSLKELGSHRHNMDPKKTFGHTGF